MLGMLTTLDNSRHSTTHCRITPGLTPIYIEKWDSMVPQGTFFCIKTRETHFYPDNWRQFIIDEASDFRKGYGSGGKAGCNMDRCLRGSLSACSSWYFGRKSLLVGSFVLDSCGGQHESPRAMHCSLVILSFSCLSKRPSGSRLSLALVDLKAKSHSMRSLSFCPWTIIPGSKSLDLLSQSIMKRANCWVYSNCYSAPRSKRDVISRAKKCPWKSWKRFVMDDGQIWILGAPQSRLILGLTPDTAFGASCSPSF